ncbi:hypothetical protein AB1Y20_017422 [Prymnesium parvum]|uniref:Aminoglycoside phosphotransferase domain-containing protein n=1 Tax=Prymnesium parvum TaxID=97485 RepID=A0AB34JMM1_PRYPA
MQCSWSWRSRRCELKPTSSDGDAAASTMRCRLKLAPTWPTMRCVPSEPRPPIPSPAPTPLLSPPEAPQGLVSSVVPFELCISLLVVALFALWRWLSHGLLATCARLLLQRGRKRAGVHTGVVFPTCVADLRGRDGAAYVTKMLRHGRGAGRRLPPNVRVTSVVVRDTHAIDDGVKGDKVVIDVRYSGATDLPTAFFVKFNIDALSPMRLLVEASDVCKCEAYFYHTLQHSVPVRSPEAYFVDYSPSSGEFVLLSEVVQFAARGAEAVAGSVLPLKHRIRDVISEEEQQAFIVAGAKLNAQFWSGRESVLSRETPRFEETHARLWTLIQLTGLTGLHHSTKCTLKGRRVNPAFMTWNPPQELVGRELEIIRDMPTIMRSLCEDESMVAFGHNDLMLDNAYFWRTVGGALEFGLFDWQQACLNNVGQEWAWNFHFLPPDFLTAHEDEFISLILKTYAEHGVELSRERFVEAYVLGTAQMYVFSGAGLQALLGDLHRHQLYMTLQPDDPRCRLSCAESGLPKALHEKLVGAEMSRRAFTNVCNIMRRHDFAGAWARWREARASRRDSLRRSSQHSVGQTAGVAAGEAAQAVAKVDAAKFLAAGLEATQEEAATVAAAKVEGTNVEAALVEAARLDMDAAKVGAAKAEMASEEAAQAEVAGVDAAGVNTTSAQAASVEVAKVDGTKAKAATRMEAAEVEAETAEATKVKMALVEAAKVEAAKAETAKVESIKIEAGKAEAARMEAVKVEMTRMEAAKVEEAEARRVEAAKVKAAKVAAAKVEAAKVEAAKVEEAKAEAARMQAARLELAKMEAAKAEAARVEAAKAEAARVEAAKAEAARVEAAKAEAARVEAAKAEAARVEEAKAEAARVEAAKAEAARVEAAKAEAARVEAAKAEAARVEAAKLEEAKAEAERVKAAETNTQQHTAATPTPEAAHSPYNAVDEYF